MFKKYLTDIIIIYYAYIFIKVLDEIWFEYRISYWKFQQNFLDKLVLIEWYESSNCCYSQIHYVCNVLHVN